jgi:stage III sporulation protein AB
MMTKFLFGIALVAFGSFCGYFLAKKYRQRKSFFSQLRLFNERFINEVSYYRRPIREFANVYAFQGEFHSLLTDFLQNMGENGGGWSIDEREYAFLKKEERGAIHDYFLMIGRGDSASQKAYFSSVSSAISKWDSEASLAAKKYGDLYIKLGFLCGLFILILIM